MVQVTRAAPIQAGSCAAPRAQASGQEVNSSSLLLVLHAVTFASFIALISVLLASFCLLQFARSSREAMRPRSGQRHPIQQAADHCDKGWGSVPEVPLQFIHPSTKWEQQREAISSLQAGEKGQEEPPWN